MLPLHLWTILIFQFTVVSHQLLRLAHIGPGSSDLSSFSAGPTEPYSRLSTPRGTHISTASKEQTKGFMARRSSSKNMFSSRLIGPQSIKVIVTRLMVEAAKQLTADARAVLHEFRNLQKTIDFIEELG